MEPFDLIWLLDRISERDIRTNLLTELTHTVVIDGEWQKNRLEAFIDHTYRCEAENRGQGVRPLSPKTIQFLSDRLLTLPKGDKNDEFQSSEYGEALEFIYSAGPAWGLLTDDLLEPLISVIEREENTSDFINADLYLKLDTGASPKIRGRFICQVLEYEPSSNENRVSRTYDKMSDYFLGVESEIDEEFADELYDHIEQVVNSKETKAIDTVEAGFYFYESGSIESRNKFSDTIVSLINNWSTKYARKSMEWAIKYDNDAVFDNSKIFHAYISQVPDKFSNANNVSKVISQFPTKFETELNEKMERLINSRDDERQLGAEIFNSSPDRFDDTQDLVVEICLQKARRADTDYRESYLSAVAKIYTDIEESSQQTFIDQLEGFLDEKTSSDYQAFSNVWKEISGELKPRYKRQIADAIIDALEVESVPPEELVLVFYSVHDDLSEGKLQRCVEIMINELSRVNKKQARTIFNLLSECPDFTDSEDAVLTRVESFLNQNNTKSSTNDAISSVLTALEENGRPDEDRIDDIREKYFRCSVEDCW